MVALRKENLARLFLNAEKVYQRKLTKLNAICRFFLNQFMLEMGFIDLIAKALA